MVAADRTECHYFDSDMKDVIVTAGMVSITDKTEARQYVYIKKKEAREDTESSPQPSRHGGSGMIVRPVPRDLSSGSGSKPPPVSPVYHGKQGSWWSMCFGPPKRLELTCCTFDQ